MIRPSMLLRTIQRPILLARQYGRDVCGAAAIEIALWALIIVLPVLSAVDLGFFVYQRMQLEHATKMAAQAAWRACGPVYLPATNKCPGYPALLTTAIQSSSTLGNRITVTAQSEGYYCMVGSTLTPTGGSLANDTTICANGSRSADYIQVTGSLNFTPIFTGVTVASLLPTTITKTVWMRLG